MKLKKFRVVIKYEWTMQQKIVGYYNTLTEAKNKVERMVMVDKIPRETIDIEKRGNKISIGNYNPRTGNYGSRYDWENIYW